MFAPGSGTWKPRGAWDFACNPGRWVLRFAANRTSRVLMLILFLARAGRVGLFQRWVGQLAAASEDWSFVLVLAMCVSAIFCQHVRTAVFVAMLAVMFVTDFDIVLTGLGWGLQVLSLITEIALSIADFVLCGLWIWFGLFNRGFGGALVGLSPTEWIVTALVHIWLCLAAYAIFGMRLERWRARSLVEAGIRWALERPFRATFKRSEFLRQCNAAQNENFDSDDLSPVSPQHEMPRSLSEQFLNCVEVLPEVELRQLEERHAALLALRQAMLEAEMEFTMLPESLILEVRRDNILEDSFDSLQSAPVSELMAPMLQVSYTGEEGADAGGLSRDWFDAVGQQLAVGAEECVGTSLLCLGESSRMLVPRARPARTAEVDEETYLRHLMLAGRFLALGVVHGGRPLHTPLSPLICKYMLGRTVGLVDVEALDHEFFHRRVAPLLRPGGLNELEAALGEQLFFMSAPTDVKPIPEELEPGGASRVVTEDNRLEYLHLLCESFLCGEIRQELQCLLQGIWDVLPLDVLRESGLTPGDLAALLAGTPGLDVSEWQRCSIEELPAGQAAEQVVGWFWSVVREFEEEQRMNLLRFVTGSGRLPAGGFAALSPCFTLVVCGAESPERLPRSHTCVSRLVLPCYQSRELLMSKLLQAIGTRNFGVV